MSNPNEKRKPEKGAFEAFRSDWLLQVAADREAKSAMPIAAVIAHKYLNREKGHAWPGVKSLMEATGASSENTVRNALRVLVKRGHAFIKWSDGGNGNTNIICPLVDKQPFKFLKGFDIAFDTSEPSKSNAETLQVSALQPFKKLKATLLKEPLELQAEAARPSAKINNYSPHQLIEDEKPQSDGSERLSARPSMTGGEEDNLSTALATFIPEVHEIDLDSCPTVESSDHEDVGPHIGDQIDVGGGVFIQITEEDDDEMASPEEDEWGAPLEGEDADYANVLPYDNHHEEKRQAWR